MSLRRLQLARAALLLVGVAFAASNALAGEWHWRTTTASEEAAASYKLKIGNSVLQVDFAPGDLDLGTAPVLDHIGKAVSAIVAYYGRFPIARGCILVVPLEGRGGEPRGTTWGDMHGCPAFTRLGIGQDTTQADLDDDWVTTHEMAHWAFPSQRRDHHWIEEGLATYVEPLARVKTGELAVHKVWHDMVRDMHQGEPQSGDEGLDRTHTWGRTYWGGAMFCMMADIEIRRETRNRKGLEDALKGIVNAGGTIDHQWPLEKTFEIGDRASGTHVLMTMYAKWKDAPVTVDLEKVWAQLGVQLKGDTVQFDRNAPLARIREAIAGDSKHKQARL